MSSYTDFHKRFHSFKKSRVDMSAGRTKKRKIPPGRYIRLWAGYNHVGYEVLSVLGTETKCDGYRYRSCRKAVSIQQYVVGDLSVHSVLFKYSDTALQFCREIESTAKAGLLDYKDAYRIIRNRTQEQTDDFFSLNDFFASILEYHLNKQPS